MTRHQLNNTSKLFQAVVLIISFLIFSAFLSLVFLALSYVLTGFLWMATEGQATTTIEPRIALSVFLGVSVSLAAAITSEISKRSR